MKSRTGLKVILWCAVPVVIALWAQSVGAQANCNIGSQGAICGTPLSVTCSANPTSAGTGDTVTWTATARNGIARSGETVNYFYEWSGNENLVGNGPVVQWFYDTTGSKVANVRVTTQYENVTAGCQVTIGSTLLPNWENCSQDSQCQSGFCSLRIGRCQPLNTGGVGTVCEVDRECQLTLSCVNGTCRSSNNSNLPNGSNCTQGSQCASGYCSNTTLTCGFPPQPPVNSPPVNYPGNPPPNSTTINNPLNVDSIYEFLAKALEAFVDLLIPVIVIFYVVTGLMFITARGKPTELAVAKTAFLYTTIGAGVVLGAWVFAKAIENTINVIKGP